MTSGPNSPARPWWHRDRHEDRRGRLLARNRIQNAIRGWLAQEDFVEVDPLGLQLSPGNEAHLHAFSTRALGPDGTGRMMYLHTSPEFAMKKLLAAGETRIATFAHVWRNRERGPRHSPEFTLLEWYRSGADYTQLMADCTALCRLAARIAGASLLRQGDLICDPFAAPERLSVTDAFARHAGIDLLATLDAAGRPQPGAMEAALDAAGIRRAPDDDWSDMFSRVLVERVEPRLGQGRLTFLDRYPLIEAALARPCPDDPRFAERFELYACGVELANGFGELTDADEQRRRFTHEMDLKQALYGERYPLDEEFLAALAQMPPAAGIALGFERLVMLATGAVRIDEVIWTPLA